MPGCSARDTNRVFATSRTSHWTWCTPAPCSCRNDRSKTGARITARRWWRREAVQVPEFDFAASWRRPLRMISRRHNVVRVMTYLADDLEARQYPMAGVLRQLAREVGTMQGDGDIDIDSCRCGEPIVQPRTGRPRKHCFSCSPRKRAESQGGIGTWSQKTCLRGNASASLCARPTERASRT